MSRGSAASRSSLARYPQSCRNNWNCKRTPLLTGCALEIERIPAVTHCGACGQDYPTVPQGKRCPRCGSEDTWLIQGNEFIIKEIAVPDG